MLYFSCQHRPQFLGFMITRLVIQLLLSHRQGPQYLPKEKEHSTGTLHQFFNIKKGITISSNPFLIKVLEAGLEPARPQWPQDFKSCVSTNSTTRALNNNSKKILPCQEDFERETGFEPATPTLARSCSTS